jgi:hypothetical protein
MGSRLRPAKSANAAERFFVKSAFSPSSCFFTGSLASGCFAPKPSIPSRTRFQSWLETALRRSLSVRIASLSLSTAVMRVTPSWAWER